ncbi:MarR family winged helix-turn-helix transcriptional regulator [Streptosporangium sp. NPDC023963]|uniref:MarR family winged helix-turn-helix transcriptional regulator n=1 Tax=Streptosporangium sp. NPDC023963 TaxID=3155608 RepID=UPI0034216372
MRTTGDQAHDRESSGPETVPKVGPKTGPETGPEAGPGSGSVVDPAAPLVPGASSGPGAVPALSGGRLPVAEQAGPALFALIRYWSRRWPQGVAGDGAEGGHVSRVVVVDIIGGRGGGGGGGESGGGAGGAGVTGGGGGGGRTGVRAVADALGVDRSVASRMVADAVAAGLVRRGTMERDARHADLALTASGHELLAAARRWQNDTFDAFTAHWPAEDRETFASLLVRFAADATAPRRE